MTKPSAGITDEIRQAIIESGLSRYRICKSIGFDPGGMYRFMHGKEMMSLRVLERLADYLDLHITPGPNYPPAATEGRQGGGKGRRAAKAAAAPKKRQSGGKRTGKGA